jgi:hypothetical protein
MGRCRFVQPEVVRLLLADVAKRALADLSKADVEHADTKAAQEKIRQDRQDKLDNLTAKIVEAERDGDYIDVKKSLNAGEQRRIFSRMMNEITPGEKFTLKPDEVGKTKIIEYLVGWSFVDTEGKPVPVSEAAIDNLDTETYADMTAAIDWHESALVTQREDERKYHNGAAGSKTTSGSVAP